MAHYYFDSRDEAQVIVDDVGLDLPDLEQVKRYASKALAEIAMDVLPGVCRRCLGIDVRDALSRPVLMTELTFEARVLAVT
jgi:hypothetical protein